jgi:hypothetical protein
MPDRRRSRDDTKKETLKVWSKTFSLDFAH